MPNVPIVIRTEIQKAVFQVMKAYEGGLGSNICGSNDSVDALVEGLGQPDGERITGWHGWPRWWWGRPAGSLEEARGRDGVRIVEFRKGAHTPGHILRTVPFVPCIACRRSSNRVRQRHIACSSENRAYRKLSLEQSRSLLFVPPQNCVPIMSIWT